MVLFTIQWDCIVPNSLKVGIGVRTRIRVVKFSLNVFYCAEKRTDKQPLSKYREGLFLYNTK